jgi:uncharacterized membrane protein
MLLPAGLDANALSDTGGIVGEENQRVVALLRGKRRTLPGKTDKAAGRSRDSALGVSSNGIACGRIGWLYGEPFQEPGLATLWRDGRLWTAPKVAGYSNGCFSGVNARGEAVGYAAPATMWESSDSSGEFDAAGIITNSHTKAIYWDGKKLHVEGWGSLSAVHDSGAMVGSVDGQAVHRTSGRAPWTKLTPGVATALNARNQVCGNRVAGDSKEMQSQVTANGKTDTTYFPLWRAFLWEGGKPADLRPLPGFEHSKAAGISDDGWVVGVSGNGEGLATLWRSGGKPERLDALTTLHGWKLLEARAITSQGKILCVAEKGKRRRCVLLTLVR